MEINEYLNSVNDLSELYKIDNVKCSKQNDLYILKYEYNTLNNTDSWKKYCKGLIINKNKKIVMLPPMKANEVYLNDLNKFNLDEISFEELLDGIMINIFYDINQNCWKMSTRSQINGKNTWKGGNFEELFKECYFDFNYEKLDINKTYSFLMKHKKNRIISPIIKNMIILVEVRDSNTLEKIDLEMH